MTSTHAIAGVRLANRTALISGASRGIGAAIARAYAAEGANLWLVATDAGRIAEFARSIDPCGERVGASALDVRERTQCEAAVAQAIERFGQIDILVNNAGIYHAAAFVDHAPEDFQRLLDVNLFGVIHLTQAVLPTMRAQRYGRIVDIASTAGKAGSRNQSGYNISKHAVVGLTRCLALEMAAEGITVNAICPGFVETDLVEGLKREWAGMGVPDPDRAFQVLLEARVPMARALQPQEITGMAVHLASEGASGITGQSILIDGGMITA